ncbi:hypothetical protein E1B28_006060 [Marasmius oreades]|nr:uncharacterized protein E1B28_006060 [Marasmius oreades]KAG7095291.1 hypothetical protein E1B28_006060 [Marasmius oreades]
MPGDKMTFDWRDGDGNKHWPHDMGPMLTYMAPCGNRPCNEFDPMDAKWFKIQETGMLPDRTWKQADLKHGDTIHAVIPNNLASGNYLVRSEIIALHNANEKHGAEFYVDCVQIRVGGNKSGKPADKDVVKFPGAYSDEDPGIWVPKIYDGLQPSDYVIPGPRIAPFITGNSDGSASILDSSAEEGKGYQQSNSSDGTVPTSVSEDNDDCDDSSEGQSEDSDAEVDHDEQGLESDSCDDDGETSKEASDMEGDEQNRSSQDSNEHSSSQDISSTPNLDAQRSNETATRARHTSSHIAVSKGPFHKPRFTRLRRTFLAH